MRCTTPAHERGTHIWRGRRAQTGRAPHPCGRWCRRSAVHRRSDCHPQRRPAKAQWEGSMLPSAAPTSANHISTCLGTLLFALLVHSDVRSARHTTNTLCFGSVHFKHTRTRYPKTLLLVLVGDRFARSLGRTHLDFRKSILLRR